MICNTKIKRKMKFIKTKLYDRCYQYTCSDGFMFTIIDSNKKEKAKDLKNSLLPKIKQHLFEKGLEE